MTDRSTSMQTLGQALALDGDNQEATLTRLVEFY
jgi:hypothetical protein